MRAAVKMYLEKITFICVALVMITGLHACTVEETTVQKGEISEDNVFKGYSNAIEKAQGVEQTLMDADQRRRQELENQEF